MNVHGCTIVFYHYVRDIDRTPFPGIKGLSVAGFAEQLDWLQSRFDIIDGAAFDRALMSGTGFDRPAALLTFDDGFIDHYEHVFPILESRRLGGIFFIAGATLGDRPRLLNVHKTHFLLSHLGPDRFAQDVAAALESEQIDVRREPEIRRESEIRGGPDMQRGPLRSAADGRDGIYRYDEALDVRIKRILNYEAPYPVVDRVLSRLFEQHLGDSEAFARALYVSEAQIAEMARGGLSFGFHTETHPVLSRLDRQEQWQELHRGPQLVRDLTGQNAVSFCYPYGFTHTYNTETLQVLEECGYSMAFNTARREAMIGGDPRFELPRFDTRDVARLDEVTARA